MSHSHVAVVGAGFGGLAVAIRLQQAGVDDVVLFELADDVGGCWRDNTYPGAACDVPSHLYSLSFAPKHDWSRRFAEQPEILDYLRGVATDSGVRRKVRFSTEVVSAAFEDGTWTLELSDGTTHTCRVLVSATGQLSRPSVPDLPGLPDFEGDAFHSARWRHDVDVTGRDVAVMGTGASAIQVVPHLAATARSVTVFQRDAAHVIAKPDRPYRRAFPPALQRLNRWRNYWQNETRIAAFQHPSVMRLLERRFIRHLASSVSDSELRSTLTSSSPMGCKRILISNDYYAALAQPHVTVVPHAVASVRPDGLVDTTGAQHPADVLVLCTGFATHDFLAPMRVVGRHGTELSEAWRNGARTHLGVTVSDFPNLFLLYGPGTNLAHSSITLMLETQASYVVQAVRALDGAAWMDVRPEVQDAYDTRLQQRLAGTVWAQGCSSWYKSADGRIDTNWSGSVTAYRRRLRRLRLADFHVEPVRERVPS